MYYPILYDGLIFIGWWLGLFKLFPKKSDLSLQKQASRVKTKIEQQKIIDENNLNNQDDEEEDDDYTEHIRKIAEANKTRFKNVTMNANFKH